MIQLIKVVLLIFLPLNLMAYIPDSHMILKRTAENNGDGLYKIEQEVVFPLQPKPFRVLERWFIKEAAQMRLEVRGIGDFSSAINMQIIYDSNRRYYLDSDGKKKILPAQDELIESFLFFKDINKFKRQLVHLHMAPRNLLYNSPSSSTYQLPSFIKLSRADGVVNYAFYESEEEKLSPRLWIEQDHFLVKKIRFPSKALFHAREYKRYPRGLWHPQNMEIQWNGQKVTIYTKDVQALALTQERKKILLHTGLEKETASLKLPDIEIVKDFYKNFR